MRTKIFALVSALFLSAQLFASDFVVDGICYNFLDGDSIAVTTSNGYEGYSGSITIPETVEFEGNTYHVTSIARSSFQSSDITSVTIPNSVTVIGEEAFYNCSSLTSVTLGNGVTTVGENAFVNTGLTEPLYNNHLFVYMPHSYSGAYIIPEGIKEIASGAFAFCVNLTALTIPSTIEKTGVNAFSNLDNLTSIIWNAKHTQALVGGSWYQSSVVFGGVSYDDETPWESQVTSVTFGEGVEYIPNYICSGMKKLTTITIPESVTRIGTQAFNNCSSLTSITIPQNVTTIDEKAFYNLDGLTSVIWNATNCSSVNSWGQAVVIFSGDNVYDDATGQDIPWESPITSFTFGDDVTHIPASICANMSKLTQVTLSTSVTNIGQQAFYNCSSLTELTIPENIDTIGSEAFANLTSLTSVTWNAVDCITTDYNSPVFEIKPDNSERVPNTSITSFTFGSNVKNIPSYLCDDLVSLTNITLPNSVTNIGQQAFYNCSSLTELTIPANVDSIGSEAFANLTSLTSVTWNAVDCITTDYNSPIFKIKPDNSERVPNTSITSFTFGSSVKNIPSYLCYDLVSLTNITLPNSVTTIGSAAFRNCSGITSLTIPASLQSIGRAAFYNCTNLTSITWNAINCSCTGQIFEGTSPSTFTFGSEVESIPESLCSGFNKLTSIHIPEKVKTIGGYAFNRCEGLTSVDIPNSVTAIGSSAFCNSSNLQSITIGTGLDSVGYEPFAYCDNLRKFICHSTKSFKIDSEYKPYPGALENANLDTIIAPAVFFDYPESRWSVLAKNLKYIQVNSGELTADAFSVINRSFDKLQTLDIAAATNTEIANNAFKGCYKLENLRLPAQLEYIGYMALADCKSLQSVEIPATVTDIDDSAFENCRSIQNVTFANGAALERIGNWAFYNCHEIQHLTIPEGVTEIGSAAFYGCVYLQDITLPSTLKMMGDNSFALCSKLQKITSLATVPPTIEAKTFYEVSRSTPLYVPKASLTAYEGDMYWKEFLHIQAAPEVTTDLEQVDEVTDAKNCKLLENGQVIIIRDGVRYNVLGVRL